ncbi:M56 family metallopeptidase [Pontibacter roseus]|uniref:M56 family metallopeptidase n=1 Tax=Pontibacter roseus TaxID=336989 RepID=UPI00038054AD|nr:M56 family metallopeptidase [Pontibacter roseus]
METTVNYILQSGLCLLLLYLFYRLVLRDQPSLRYNRLFLLLAPAVALAAPLLRIPLPFAAQLPVATLPSIQLQEVVVTGYSGATPAAESSISLGTALLALYTLVGLVLLGRLVWQLVRLRRLAAAATPLNEDAYGATVLQVETHHPTFAFLNRVFLNRQAHLSSNEQRQVLAHELAHVRLRHTYDVLYYEVLTAILWFNPLVWLLKGELRDVHEYQADAEVLSEYKPQEYSSLLAKEALYTAGIPVGSYFQKPQVFRRLRMLQKHGRKASLLRPLLALPLLFALLITFSANSVNADMAVPFAEAPALNETLITSPAKKAASATANQGQLQPEEHLANDTKAIPEKLTFTQPAEKAVAHTDTEKPAAIPAQPEVASPEKVKPYTFVEQMPQFQGGDSEMLKFLGRNIRYPQSSQEAGVEGLVVVSFVVEADGSLHDIAILKKLDDATDQEALRVVEEMNGYWNAGRQNGKPVPVRYTLPVRFAMK